MKIRIIYALILVISFGHADSSILDDRTKACNNGDKDACMGLANIYHFGNGVKQDTAKAIMYVGKACDFGNAQGCQVLGDAYMTGDGVERDSTKAFIFASKSCDGGNAAGCCTAGIISADVQQDFTKAKMFFSKSCDLNYENGCKGYFLLNKSKK